MREEALQRIARESIGLPDRWREVLESALLNENFSSEAELFFQSALSVHSHYPTDLEPAEAILAGDAFIPMAVRAMLDNNCSLEELEVFLNNTVSFIDR